MIAHSLKLLYSAAVDLIYPPVCLVTNRELTANEEYISADAFRLLTRIAEPFCMRCGAPVNSGSVYVFSCNNCPDDKVYYDLARAVFDYNDIFVRDIISAYKYEFFSNLATVLGKVLFEGFHEHYSEVHLDAIVPVPLHKKRLREREFNQSERLAAILSGCSGIPISTSCIERTRKTKPQIYLNPEDRKKNIHGAFRVLQPDAVRNKALLVVDDVVTTGSTVNEVCFTLRESGAAKLYILSLARAFKNQDGGALA